VSGVFNTSQQVGGALGLALLTSLAAGRTGSATTGQALTAGYHLAWETGAVLGIAAIAVAAVALHPASRGRRPRPDECDSQPPMTGSMSHSSGAARALVPEDSS
jgi:hypothetical protein